jgi:hypothetical protein
MPIPPRSRAAASPSWPVRIAGLALLLAAFALLSASQASAAKKTPCWKQVVQDWYDDSTIDRFYERHCYTDALNNVGEDVKVYSSFEEDIKAALQRASREDIRELSVGGSRGDQPGQGPFKDAFDRTNPRNADSMPIPLMILGGLALLLVSAGAAGLLRRRLRARRVSPP